MKRFQAEKPAAIPVYQLPAQPEKSFAFEIHSMDWLAQERHARNEIPHKHGYYVIVWVWQAVGTHVIDMVTWALTPQTLYFLTPGQTHQLETEAHPEGVVISFTDDFFCLSEPNESLTLDSGLFYRYQESRPLELTADESAALRPLAENLMQEYAAETIYKNDVIRSYLKVFLLKCTAFQRERGESDAVSRSSGFVRQFRQLIEKHFHTKHAVSDYAELMHVTANHLNETVKKFTGITAGELIRFRIILEAKRFAFYSDRSLKEVSLDLGFEDMAHFSKYFKNATNSTFTDYREQIRKQANAL